jgi:hypothetical protein
MEATLRKNSVGPLREMGRYVQLTSCCILDNRLTYACRQAQERKINRKTAFSLHKRWRFGNGAEKVRQGLGDQAGRDG